jgi:hypothetical protein
MDSQRLDELANRYNELLQTLERIRKLSPDNSPEAMAIKERWPKAPNYFSKKIDEIIDEISGAEFDETLPAGREEDARVLRTNFTMLKTLGFKKFGLGKPKKCRKCGLYKL